MRSTLTNRLRSNSLPLNTIPPTQSSPDFSLELSTLAARILYRSPLPSPANLRIFILNSAAFPDANQDYYDRLLPYVLARLPQEAELIGGLEYEIIFFAGGKGGDTYSNKRANDDGDEGTEEAASTKKKGPGFGWTMKAYNALNRVTRKRLQKLWIVHQKGWVRVMVEMFATVVSPKFRKKVVHASSLTALAFQFPIEDLLIPPSAYFTDRRKVSDIDVPYASGKRAFGVRNPLPSSAFDEKSIRLPRVLRETTSFVLTDSLAATEGLFRVSARQQTVDVLKEAYDRGQKYIVWHEGDSVLTYPHYKEGYGEVAIQPEELENTDGYDVHTAAALIKLWYKELQDPLFPCSSYQALERIYGDPKTALDRTMLLRMLNPGVEYSPLPEISRQILIKHLLPLLAHVSSYSKTNKMTVSNLAVCFTPSLLHGPDPIEDMKILPIIQRLLTAMIQHWSIDLAPALDPTPSTFVQSLQPPKRWEDGEDPLEEPRNTPRTITNQISGITLLDNDSSRLLSSSSEEFSPDNVDRPPLPPRPREVITVTTTGIQVESSPIHRKPAPPLQTPPRYSSLLASEQAIEGVAGIQRARTQPTGTVEVLDDDDDEGVGHTGEAQAWLNRASIDTLPVYEEFAEQSVNAGRDEDGKGLNIPRKPVGEGKG